MANQQSQQNAKLASLSNTGVDSSTDLSSGNVGAAGIIIGFIARRRGATGLGAWAIGIGAVSIIVGIFILQFF